MSGIKSRKSQAISELAILGALILAAFGAILLYVQSMNSQQSLQMRAFRKALAKSRETNRVVSYTVIRDNPVIDVQDIFGRPDTSRLTASSTVVAVRKDPFFASPEDKSDRDSREFYELNGKEYLVEPIKVSIEYDDDDYTTWISAPIREFEYQIQKQREGNLVKREDSSSISTTHSGRVTVQDTTNLILEDKSTFERDYLEDLQDEVEQEPWEKRMQNERTLRRVMAAGEFGAALLAGAALNTILDAIGTKAGCLSGLTVKAAILGGSSLLLSEVFNYFLNESTATGEARNVRIVEGYRESDSISGGKIFSLPSSTFSVSQ